MVLIVLHAASAATAGAGWSLSGVIPDLCSDDLLLKARQQPLRLGQGQTQVGDIGEVTEPVERALNLMTAADRCSDDRTRVICRQR
jgi:hypothetical protein